MIELKMDQYDKLIRVALDTKINTFIWGPSGIGKSQQMEATVRNYAKEKGIDYIFSDVRLSDRQPDDWGIPQVIKDTNGDDITTHTRPGFLPPSDYKGLFVIMFDEYPLGGRPERAAVMQIVTERRLRQFSLPENTVIFAAGNYTNSSHGGQPLKEQEKKRWCHVQVTTDKKSIRENLRSKIDSLTYDLIGLKNFVPFSEDREDWTLDQQVSVCPRLIAMHGILGSYIQHSVSIGTYKDPALRAVLTAMSQGLIGELNSQMYFQLLNDNTTINYLECLQSPETEFFLFSDNELLAISDFVIKNDFSTDPINVEMLSLRIEHLLDVLNGKNNEMRDTLIMFIFSSSDPILNTVAYSLLNGPNSKLYMSHLESNAFKSAG
jgi:hypothetical protein